MTPWFVRRYGVDGREFRPVRWQGWVVAALLTCDLLYFFAEVGHWFHPVASRNTIIGIVVVGLALQIVIYATSAEEEPAPRDPRDLRGL